MRGARRVPWRWRACGELIASIMSLSLRSHVKVPRGFSPYGECAPPCLSTHIIERAALDMLIRYSNENRWLLIMQVLYCQCSDFIRMLQHDNYQMGKSIAPMISNLCQNPFSGKYLCESGKSNFTE